MYTGTLAAVSNRESWLFTIKLSTTDGTAVDLTDATVDLAVRSPESQSPILTGSIGDHITEVDAENGELEVSFTPAEMSVLRAGTYDVGIRVTLADGYTYQLLSGNLPVVDGVVLA